MSIEFLAITESCISNLQLIDIRFWSKVLTMASYYLTAKAQGCCKRYSLSQGMSNIFHDIPESSEQYIPLLFKQ